MARTIRLKLSEDETGMDVYINPVERAADVLSKAANIFSLDLSKGYRLFNVDGDEALEDDYPCYPGKTFLVLIPDPETI